MSKEKFKIPLSNNKKYNTNKILSKTKKFDVEEKIKLILSSPMNKECFDCGSPNPKFISINNGIFLCVNCVIIHYQLPNDISEIKNNNLFTLSNKEILYIYYGGNKRLNNFVNYEYPGLQNYQPNILYQTQAMNYYRKRLNATVLKLKKPTKPNSLYAYKLIGEISNKYSKNRFLFEANDNITTKLNNSNNIINNNNHLNIDNNKIENGKHYYNQVFNNNIINIKNNGINIGSSYIKNPDTFYNINSNWRNKTKGNNIERNNNKKEIVNHNIYNNTFFEEMKNIFEYKNLNLMRDLRIKSNNDLTNDNYKLNNYKNDYLTHKASLTNTFYFPKLNDSNSNNNNNNSNYKNDFYKKINLQKFSSLNKIEYDNKKNKIKNKNKNSNLNKKQNLKIYIRPRMSNNSFSKNPNKIQSIEICNISNTSLNRKTIVHEMTQYSIRNNYYLREHSPINNNKKENGFIPGTEYSSKSTNRKQFSKIDDIDILPTSRNEMNYKLNNYINRENEHKSHTKDNNDIENIKININHKNQYKKSSLHINDNHYSNIMNQRKNINEYNNKTINSTIYKQNNNNISFNNNLNKNNKYGIIH